MNFEENYKKIAEPILEFITNSSWDIAGSKTKILENMTETGYWRKKDKVLYENDKFPSLETEIAASKAIISLRDNLLATIGDRIWGLTFTLYPDGKFNIEYDYNKPEGYEETDETISMDEAIKGLSDFN